MFQVFVREIHAFASSQQGSKGAKYWGKREPRLCSFAKKLWK
jgi:hypothetical protein